MAWRPGDLVLDDTEIAGPCSAITFGQGDPGFDLIAQKLASRNCTMVGQLRDWGAQEFISVIRPLKLKKHPKAYLAAMEIALILKLEDKPGNDGDDVKVKTETGGDMMDRSSKLKPSMGFNPSKYDFDALLYDYLPAKNSMQFLDEENEKLVLDMQGGGIICIRMYTYACACMYMPYSHTRRIQTPYKIKRTYLCLLISSIAQRPNRLPS